MLSVVGGRQRRCAASTPTGPQATPCRTSSFAARHCGLGLARAARAGVAWPDIRDSAEAWTGIARCSGMPRSAVARSTLSRDPRRRASTPRGSRVGPTPALCRDARRAPLVNPATEGVRVGIRARPQRCGATACRTAADGNPVSSRGGRPGNICCYPPPKYNQGPWSRSAPNRLRTALTPQALPGVVTTGADR